MIDPATFAPAILTIDLGEIVANWRQLRDRGGAAECAGVVKANAYGLGAHKVVPALYSAGCRTFFVAVLDEAIRLRAMVPEARIVALGGLPPGSEPVFARHGIVPVLNHLGEIGRWQAFCRARHAALPAAVHIDTGMNRLGLGPDELDRLADDHGLLAGFDLQFFMTHLACGDDPGPMSAEQNARFRAALARLPAAKASFANSAGVLLGPDHHFDLMRPGCALYGINPISGQPNPMRQVIRLDARLLQVRNVDSTMTVGYGATHRVRAAGKIATIAVGYADGYLRSLSSRGNVFFDGVPAAVVGRVSMDLITVDVSHLPDHLLQPGRLVELIGPNRQADTVAEEAGTIGYEILTQLSARYHRVYVDPETVSSPKQ